MRKRRFSLISASALLTIVSPFMAYGAESFPTKALFGDTHLHTKLSGDARGYGLTLSPEDAYRIAKGEPIKSTSGRTVQLSQPLDFLVIADHAEGYGLMDELIKGNPTLMTQPQAKRWYGMLTKSKQSAYLAVREIVEAQGTGKLPKEMTHNPEITGAIWQDNIEIAERHYEPGRFTSLIGYEWTAMRSGNNLHRVVVFRDGAEKVKQIMPIDSNQTAHNPVQLWKGLAKYEQATGGRALTIPHNSNLSGGMMFAYEQVTGEPMTEEYAALVQRWEPLLEVTQTKGDSETHPLLSPNDEFADFETWDVANLAMTQATTPDMLPGSYARSGLRRGLEIQKTTGANPYQYGMIGSSDAHNAIPVTQESAFFGKNSQMEPSATRWKKPASQSVDRKLVNKGWKTTSSGLAAVWAVDNTREAIFDAMMRKETYATTGSRISLRMFGAWSFPKGIAANSDWVEQAYASGVPMGGTLAYNHGDKAPTFILSALKDPSGANLDRIQIIKGWVDSDGTSHEKIINVAWAGDRKLDKLGKLPSLGSTVDVATASYTNEIGSVELFGTWTDKDYVPGQQAFYYARILEIPTPRWTAYDAKEFQVDMPAEVTMTTIERAYSSPIWIQ